jgi:hypothetical protein
VVPRRGRRACGILVRSTGLLTQAKARETARGAAVTPAGRGVGGGPCHPLSAAGPRRWYLRAPQGGGPTRGRGVQRLQIQSMDWAREGARTRAAVGRPGALMAADDQGAPMAVDEVHEHGERGRTGAR